MNRAWLDEVSELLRIPSVSADPEHAGDVRRAADWVAELVRAAGGTAEILPTTAQPLVIGEIAASQGGAGVPTVLLYGHFDVQPAAPLDEWESPPFEPSVRGEWLYGRGVADDKGQLYMLLKAASLLAAERALPVNVRIACDGEEEIGGHSIVDFLAEDERGADACIIFDSGMERRGLPALAIATRGILNFDLRVRTGERDLHSGMFGNAALNATHALVQALGALLPRAGRLPEELRQEIRPLSPEERADWDEQTPGEQMLFQEGAMPYDPAAAAEFYLRTSAEPSIDVNGILGGKPGLVNTSIPVTARANFSVRLAPGQDVETMSAAVEALLRRGAPAGASLDLTRIAANPPGRVDPDAAPIRLASEVFERTVGARPLLVRSGGTLPIMAALEAKGIPAVLTGFSLPGANIHSPNERLLLEYLPLGVETARELLTAFAALPQL